MYRDDRAVLDGTEHLSEEMLDEVEHPLIVSVEAAEVKVGVALKKIGRILGVYVGLIRLLD